MCQNLIPFLRLNNIPLCVYTTFCLSIHLWVKFGLFLPFGSCELVYKYLLKSLLSVLLSIYLEVEFPDHMVILWASLVAQMGKNLPTMHETQF